MAPVKGKGRNAKVLIDQRKAKQLLQIKESERQQLFLDAFAKLGTISRAAQAVGMQREQHYRWMDIDLTYPQRFAASFQTWCDSLVHEMFRRGVVGVDKPVIFQGKQAYVDNDPNDPSKGRRPLTVKEYSDSLLQSLAKANIAAYRQAEQEIPSGGASNADDERERITAEIHRRIARQVATIPPEEGDRPAAD